MNPFTIELPAPEGTIYAPDAFSHLVAQPAALELNLLGDGLAGHCPARLLAAEVVDLGHAVILTIEPEERR